MPELLLSVEHPDGDVIDKILSALEPGALLPAMAANGCAVSLTVDGEDVPA